MAENVFGEPIITGNLEHRAREAFENQTVGGKKDKAKSYVTQRNGNSSQVSTLVIFYNATGNPMTLNPNVNDKHGKIDDGGYPITVENGQWGAFRHVEEGSHRGSEGYVVFDHHKVDGTVCKSLMAWYVVHTQLESTTPNPKHLVYCDIYDGADPSDVYKNMEENDRLLDFKKGFGLKVVVEAKSTNDPPNDVAPKKMSAWYEGIISREN